MERYLNLGGNSSVIAYENGGDFIIVQFGDGKFYLYNYESAGVEDVEQAKILALAGRGLNSYINRYMKKKYAKEW